MATVQPREEFQFSYFMSQFKKELCLYHHCCVHRWSRHKKRSAWWPGDGGDRRVTGLRKNLSATRRRPWWFQEREHKTIKSCQDKQGLKLLCIVYCVTSNCVLCCVNVCEYRWSAWLASPAWCKLWLELGWAEYVWEMLLTNSKGKNGNTMNDLFLQTCTCNVASSFLRLTQQKKKLTAFVVH